MARDSLEFRAGSWEIIGLMGCYLERCYSIPSYTKYIILHSENHKSSHCASCNNQQNEHSEETCSVATQKKSVTQPCAPITIRTIPLSLCLSLIYTVAEKIEKKKSRLTLTPHLRRINIEEKHQYVRICIYFFFLIKVIPTYVL